MVQGVPPNYLNPILASGVIVQYKNRFFICTAEHFTNKEGYSVGIFTGRRKGQESEIVELGEFSYIEAYNFEETPDAEDLIEVLGNPKSGEFLDLAFKEISRPENLVQDEREFNLNSIGKITVAAGGKILPIIDDDYEISKEEVCSFYGRIRPKFEDGILHFQEALYWNLPVTNINDHFFELDLGEPVRDFTRFRGCSGAPIIDTRGRVIGLVTHGHKDPNKSSIFGYRLDKLKNWIEYMYFHPAVNP